jgi:hypothetical protein
MVLLIAASMTAILSRFSAPDILAGSTIVLTATVLPRHRPAMQQTATSRIAPTYVAKRQTGSHQVGN